MVKIREGLPLIDGQTTEDDSAALTAKMVYQTRRQFSHSPIQSAIHSTVNNQSIYAPATADTIYRTDFAQSLQQHSINIKQNRNNRYQRQQAISKSHKNATPLNNNDVSQLLTKHKNIHNSIDEDAWLDKVADRINQRHLCKLSTAIRVVQQLDESQDNKRSNNFATGLGMADILTYIYQDEDALVSAMLYRSVRKKLISIAQIKEKFGEEVANLVSDTLAMGRLSDTIEKNQQLEEHFSETNNEQLNKIYSMLISVTNDVRVVMIKLAERTFAMRELSFASAERQQRVSREVLSIYAPLAHRLGIAQIKWELEDLSFRFLAPTHYKRIAKLLAEKRSEREHYIKTVNNALKNALINANIDAKVNGRVKHIYSIYKKMKLKSLSFDQLYDIRALRVMVNTPAECYQVLGIVHSLWRHIPEQFDDYITNPKANGYRSLHTAVIAEHKSLEVQIRTHDMHFEAELGMCAHVNYKEGGKSDVYLNQKINSLRQLLSIQNSKAKDTGLDTADTVKANHPNDDSSDDSDDESFVDFGEFKKIYVFTRDGDIIELPKGATVLDCAYYIHTQVGNHAQGARVNQKHVPLTYQLKTGEQVEIIIKSSREPSRDWLMPSLGYIKTSRAKSKLRHWFNRLDRDKNIESGRQMLNKEVNRLSLYASSVNLNDYKKHFNVKHTDDILVGIATGDISIHQLTNQISKQLNLEPEQDLLTIKPSVHPRVTGQLDAYKICVDGLDNIDINLAKCCSPVRGEPISGFITISKGISIHHRGCIEYTRLIEREPERQIAASWYSDSGQSQPVAIYIEAYDRRGLLLNLTQVLDKQGINIRKVETISTEDDIAKMMLHIEVTGLSQLSKILVKLEQQAGILQAKRLSN